MKSSTVSFSYERSFNLGNFESVKIQVAQWASVDDDEDPDTVIAFLAERCKNHVRASIPKGYTPQGVAPTQRIKQTVSGIEVE